ncbi:MAG: hypothetical protein QGH65_02395 [SAR324 cluster bacterium]|jgi:hypothetical protein|nr:hypothetical protein [SAR324 cluster bacterium]
MLRPLFAQHPPYRIHDIALTATIWPNDNGDSILLKFDVNRMTEGLESGNFEALDSHERGSSAKRLMEGIPEFPPEGNNPS